MLKIIQTVKKLPTEFYWNYTEKPLGSFFNYDLDKLCTNLELVRCGSASYLLQSDYHTLLSKFKKQVVGLSYLCLYAH